jgi:hypothetical protein
MNTTSNTRLRLNYQSWSRPTSPRNQHTTFRTKTHEHTHSGNLHGLLPMLHRSDRWPAPVRPVTSVRPVDRATQASGCSSRTTSVPESLSDFSRPWNRNILKTQPARKKNPTQNLAKQHQTSQELTNNRTIQRHTIKQFTLDKSHKGLTLVRPVKSTGQTGETCAARDEQNPRVNSFKSNSRSPDSLHGSKQDFGDSRNTSWTLHCQVMVHQNSLNKEESKDFRQEHHKP